MILLEDRAAFIVEGEEFFMVFYVVYLSIPVGSECVKCEV
jgi:hypothetical protein